MTNKKDGEVKAIEKNTLKQTVEENQSKSIEKETKETNRERFQEETKVAARKLTILFRGLLGVIPSTKLSNPDEHGNRYPSSVTLLFPKADVPRAINDELGDHTHRLPLGRRDKFLKHNLRLIKGMIVEDNFESKESEIVIGAGSEIKFSEIKTEGESREINSLSLSKNSGTRRNPSNAIKLLSINIGNYLAIRSHTISLPELYDNEQHGDDQNLTVDSKYLKDNYFGNEPSDDHKKLAGRVFKLRGGVIAGFAGKIDDVDCVSEYIYEFGPHDGLNAAFKRRENITDTLIFERDLTNASVEYVEVSFKNTNSQLVTERIYSNKDGVCCFLIEHMPPRDTTAPTGQAYDYDFALVYRVASLGRTSSATPKQKRIPRFAGLSPRSVIRSSEEKTAIRPIICGLAVYDDDQDA
ncbi:MAG: hypothetical protein WAQ98_07980 [Blastocatellia bacterium]